LAFQPNELLNPAALDPARPVRLRQRRAEREAADRKAAVRAFWEAQACGERYGREHDRLRYELEPEIVAFADFVSARGKRVLEVGVGMGADCVRFAQAGAQVTGVDLTERAVEITRGRLEEEGLDGDVRVADAESLPFPDDSFDLVYSWGVLHHTPDPVAAITEARRVLAPGGRLKVMLYHRRSWTALAVWLRFALLRGKPFADLNEALGAMESPGTRAFTVRHARLALAGLGDVSVHPVLTYWDRRFVPGLTRLFGNR